MSSVNEYVIKGESIIRRTIQENEIVLADDLIPRLMEDMVTKIPDIMDVPGYGNVGLAIKRGFYYYSMAVEKVQIRTEYKILNGIFVPNLTKPGQLLTMTWVPPKEMKIKILISFFTNATDEVKPPNVVALSQMWIMAFDAKGRCYRMPMGNIYADCQLCHGQQHMASTSHQKLLLETIRAFENSQWNADLVDGSLGVIQEFFQFKPTNEGFEQIKPSEKWESYCQKVVPNVLQFII